MAEGGNTEGVDYRVQVNTSCKCFCLATLEILTKECLGGYHMLMQVDPIVTGDIPLMVIGYKHRYCKVLVFIVLEGTRSTEPGVTYLSNYPENYSDVSICPIPPPQIIGRYFSVCTVTV